ncbi:unnamed protein product [Orchesella dallaii]|uniref:Regulatory protein zeste n=1 Tax=Orchesella dallaii TaxID=48710 RepID=A0ABP1QHE6_9HEXA
MGSRLLRSSTLGIATTRGDREEKLMQVIETKKVIWKNPSCATREARVKAWNEVASQCGTSVKDGKKLFDNVKGKAKTRIESALKKGAGSTWEDVSGFVSTHLLPRSPWPLWSAIPWFCHQVFDEIVQKAETDRAMNDKAASDTKQIVKEMLGEGLGVTTSASNQYEMDIEQDQPISQGSFNNLVIDETPMNVASSSYANGSSLHGGNELETNYGIPEKKSRLASTGGQGRRLHSVSTTQAKRTKNTQLKLHIEAVPSASDIKRTTMDLKREKDDEYYSDEGIPQYQNTGPPVGAEDNTDLPTVAPPPSTFQNNLNPGLFQPQQAEQAYPFCQPFQTTIDKDDFRMYNQDQDIRHCFQSLFDIQYRAVLADKPAHCAQTKLIELKLFYNSICAQPQSY